MTAQVPGRNSGAIPQSLVGTQLGSFLLTRQLGRGGMGAVYLGEHVLIGSKVAVKVLHPHLAVHADLVARFFAEARAVNVIGHENIVSIFDMAVQPPAIHYFIMEYLEGESLAQFADDAGILTAQVAIPILAQVCEGLGAAHARGVIHRDLKPENIFLTRRGGNPHFVKVLDFGIAKLFADLTEVQTRPGAIVGTPEYMAPEQANGEEVDGRIDLYALGIIAYRLATGALPFTAENMPSVLLKQRDLIPPAPHEVIGTTDRGFSDVIMRALEKKPSRRFQTAAEFRAALLSAASRLPRPTRDRLPAITVPPPPTPRPSPLERATTVIRTPAPRGQLRARVTKGAPWLLGSLECTDVSRAGLFVSSDARPPPLMTRLQLMLELERDELPCEGDVVRHVSEEQARAWGMSPGFALQFVGTTPAVRDALEALRTGKPPPSEAQDDPQAEALLSRHRAAGEDPYALLGVPEDVPCAEAKARARELVRELDSLGARPLSVRQTREQLHLLAELHEAGERLGVPQQRLEVDLARGNWRGIARALAAGLTAGELERARETWLIRNGGVESRSRIHLATAQAWESRGAHEQALIEYARALAADPANLTLHQRHAQLLRLQGGAPQGRA